MIILTKTTENMGGKKGGGGGESAETGCGMRHG